MSLILVYHRIWYFPRMGVNWWGVGALHVSEDRVDIKKGGEDEKRKGDTPFHTMGRGCNDPKIC